MNLHALPVLMILLVSGLVFSAGCTSPASPGAATATPSPPSVVATPSPLVPTTLPVAVLTSVPATGTTAGGTPTVTSPSPAVTQITPAAMADSIDNPHLVLLDFTKDYLAENIPDCGMRAVFPGVAADPGYGIRPPESRLVGLTEEQVFPVLSAGATGDAGGTVPGPAIVTSFDPNKLGGGACVGVPASPTWNFIRIRGNFVPRNARPAEYAIGLNVRSQGRVIAQLRMNRTLVLEKPFVFTLYVPLKTSEMDLFDGLEPAFVKLA